jgi:hypothetical protein
VELHTLREVVRALAAASRSPLYGVGLAGRLSRQKRATRAETPPIRRQETSGTQRRSVSLLSPKTS